MFNCTPTMLKRIAVLTQSHGLEFTRTQVLLYTILLLVVSVLPFVFGMSGVLYLASAVVLGGVFLGYAWKIYREYSDALARKTFRFSIVYLSLLFGALLVDHYVRTVIGL